MNQYSTKIWKYDSDNLSAIQFEFLNGSSIYYYLDRNEWFGIDKHHEPINPKKVDAIIEKHDLKKEVQPIMFDHVKESLKDTSEAWRYMSKELKIINDIRNQG